MVFILWTILAAVCLVDVGEAAGTLIISPDTTESGVQPSSWDVSLNDITPVPVSFLNYFYFSTGKTVFVNPSSAPNIMVEGCSCSVSAYSTTLMISLPTDCALGSSVAFTIPAVYLAVNPGGDVSVSLSIGSNRLQTTISYTPDSPSPSRSPFPSPSQSRSPSPSAASRSPSTSPSPSRSPSPSPVTPSPRASPSPSPLPISLFVTPDTIDAGAQASFWNVTVVNLDPVQPGSYKSWSISTSKGTFLNYPAFEPDVVLAGCNASLTYGYTTLLMFRLVDGCGYGGTFSFFIPGDYLSINPGGDVTVTLSLGLNTLKTTIGFTEDSPSPSRSPAASRSPSRSPSPSPTTASPSPTPSPSRSTSPSAASRSPSSSPSPSRSTSPSPVSGSPSPSPRPSPLPLILTVIPDVVDSGAQASVWNVTVENVDPVSAGFNYFYLSTNKSAFVTQPSSSPLIDMMGCNASVYVSYSMSLMLTLDRACGVNGTFSFFVPGVYLTPNPGGAVSVRFDVGWNTLRTAVVFTDDSPSPSRSPSRSPNPSRSPAASPSPSPVSGSPSPASDSPSNSPSPVSDSPSPVSDSPSPVSASPSDSPSPTSDSPSPAPTASPDASPSDSPSPFGSPSQSPPLSASGLPSTSPSGAPSPSPPASPSGSPSASPSEAVSRLVISPDTTESRVQPSFWDVRLNNINPVAASYFNWFYFSTVKTVFVNPSSAPNIEVEGCSCTVTAYDTSLTISLPLDCALGSSVAFTIPAIYLAVNPGGDVSVSLSIGSNRLQTTISYTPDSPSPSRSPFPSPSQSCSPSPSAASRSPSSSPSPSRSPSPSPVTPSPRASPSPSPLPISLFVTPDTIDAGTQASFWNVTVVNLDPVQPGSYKSWSISTSKGTFLNYPAFEPDVVLAGCNASLTYGYTTLLMFRLADGCGYGGTFSFFIPGDYLSINPGGDVTVTLSLGLNTLKTTIGFTEDSPSPSRSPAASRSPSRSPSPSPTTASPSPTPSPSRSTSPSAASRSPSSSPSPSRSTSPSPVSGSPSPSPRPSPLPLILTVVPDVVDSGAQASVWNVTVENVDPISPGYNNFYLSTNKSAFVTRPPSSPLVEMMGCNASVYVSYSMSLTLTLDRACGVSGTFSFFVPGVYLTPNPGGAVSVKFEVGWNTLRTAVIFTDDSPSPSRSPSRSPNPSRSPAASPSPSPASGSGSPSPISDSPSPISDSPSDSPSPNSDSPSPAPTASPNASPSEVPSPSGLPPLSPSPSPTGSPSTSPSASSSTSPPESPSVSPSAGPSASSSNSPSPSLSRSTASPVSPSASPSASPTSSPSASAAVPTTISPAPSPSPSSLTVILAALRDRRADTVMNMRAEERYLLATSLNSTTLLSGPVCDTSVVATIQHCNQSLPSTVPVTMSASPESHVLCWGSGVEKAVVSKCSPSAAALQSLGLTPPADATVLHTLIIDRSDRLGNLQNNQSVSLFVPTSAAGAVFVRVYSGGDTVGQDLLSIGGSVTYMEGGCLVSAPHSSTFVTYQVENNGWWIGLAAGLGTLAGLLLLFVPIACIWYRRRKSKDPIPFEQYSPAVADPAPISYPRWTPTPGVPMPPPMPPAPAYKVDGYPEPVVPPTTPTERYVYV